MDAELRTIARVPTPISAAAFTLDGSTAAVAGASGVWVLRSADGRRLATLPSRGVTSARARSQRVARRRREWKPHRNDPHRDGGDRREDRGGRQNEGVGVRAGRRPLGGRYRRGGDRASGRRAAARLADLQSPRRYVVSLAFSPSGDRVAAGLANGTMAVWNVPSRRRLYQRLGHRVGSQVLSVELSPDGRQIADLCSRLHRPRVEGCDRCALVPPPRPLRQRSATRRSAPTHAGS